MALRKGTREKERRKNKAFYLCRHSWGTAMILLWFMFMFMMYLWDGFTGQDVIGRTLDDDCRHGSEGVDMFWSMSLELESELE